MKNSELKRKTYLLNQKKEPKHIFKSRKDDYNYGFTNEDQYSTIGNGGQRLQNNSYLLTAPSNNEDSGSPYSPSGASYTDNSYNSLPRNMAPGSILKNGSLRSRNRAYGGTYLHTVSGCTVWFYRNSDKLPILDVS